MKKEKKYAYYAMLICNQLEAMFEEGATNFISQKEMEEDPDSYKQFLHALATVAPCAVLNSMSDQENNHLEFNHIANKLCFEYCKPDKNEKQ